MTLDQFIIPILTAIPPTIAAIAALVVSVRNGKKTDDIHLQLNSRLDKFLDEIREAEFAKGVLSETEKSKPSTEDPNTWHFMKELPRDK